MPKINGSHMVTISNMWHVDTYDSQYGIRFRCNSSEGGWAKAFVGKEPTVRLTDSARMGMNNLLMHESVNVKVRIYDDLQKHYHVEEMKAREFKTLYNKSRDLVKADKLAKSETIQAPVQQRETPEMPVRDIWDEPFDLGRTF